MKTLFGPEHIWSATEVCNRYNRGKRVTGVYTMAAPIALKFITLFSCNCYEEMARQQQQTNCTCLRKDDERLDGGQFFMRFEVSNQ